MATEPKNPQEDLDESAPETVDRELGRGAEWNESESAARKPEPGISRRPDPIHTGDPSDEPRKPYGLTEATEDRSSTTRHDDGKDSTSGTKGGR